MNALDRARGWLFDVFTHNYAEQLRIHRAVQRKRLGVDHQEDTPYPGAVAGSHNPTVTIHNTGGGLMKGVLLSAALLTGGSAAGLGAARLLTPRPAAAVAGEVAAPAPPAGAAKDQAYDAIYEVRQPDGTWRQVKRERLTPAAPGSR